MSELHVTLPIPPSVNHMYVTTRYGKRRPSQEAESWLSSAQWEIKRAAMAQGWEYSQGEPIIMELVVYWPNKRRRDIHNLHKLLCDAPEKVVYHDDRHVMVRDMGIRVDRLRPRVEMVLRRAE